MNEGSNKKRKETRKNSERKELKYKKEMKMMIIVTE